MEEDGSITFFREFASVIAILQEKTTVVIEVDEQVGGLLQQLASCPYDNDTLTKIMSTLQEIVGRYPAFVPNHLFNPPCLPLGRPSEPGRLHESRRLGQRA